MVPSGCVARATTAGMDGSFRRTDAGNPLGIPDSSCTVVRRG
ncbi:hypothetical protein OUO20_21120 [Arthrobacter sp. FX8]|nr:hypothetical protein [Arthrobacter sp. FX8]WAJ33455.1 hypothetical protein OUO20_21120 [Arthrobacter sp. FX8]